ncbi:hypothetical protein SpCBS45565_g07136 [Spizellomyces sp. 'palustris']|nr:hypothetical protein SpCBS45565_g07136 [Spizellomyces sp. 'palustris']
MTSRNDFRPDLPPELLTHILNFVIPIPPRHPPIWDVPSSKSSRNSVAHILFPLLLVNSAWFHATSTVYWRTQVCDSGPKTEWALRVLRWSKHAETLGTYHAHVRELHVGERTPRPARECPLDWKVSMDVVVKLIRISASTLTRLCVSEARIQGDWEGRKKDSMSTVWECVLGIEMPCLKSLKLVTTCSDSDLRRNISNRIQRRSEPLGIVDLELTNLAAMISDETIVGIITIMPHLRTLFLSRTSATDIALTALATTCGQSLRHLSLHAAESVQTESLKSFLELTPNLRTLNIPKISPIAQSLSSPFDPSVTRLAWSDGLLLSLGESCPHLSTLDLDMWNITPPALEKSLQALAIENLRLYKPGTPLQTLPSLPHNLRMFIAHYTHLSSSIESVNQSVGILAELPNLTYLNVTDRVRRHKKELGTAFIVRVAFSLPSVEFVIGHECGGDAFGEYAKSWGFERNGVVYDKDGLEMVRKYISAYFPGVDGTRSVGREEARDIVREANDEVE